MHKMPRSPQRWTQAEDDLLRSEVANHMVDGQVKDWCAIASKIPGRTNKDCRKRWHNVLSAGMNKGHWTETEDLLLSQAVHKYGECWTRVAESVKTRRIDQCARRWKQCLNPELNRSEWSQEENQALLEAYNRYGSQWKQIKIDCFPTRSRNDIKNQYTILSRRIKRRKLLVEDKANDSGKDNLKESVYLAEASGGSPSTDTDWDSSDEDTSDDNNALMPGDPPAEPNMGTEMLEFCEPSLNDVFMGGTLNGNLDLGLAVFDNPPDSADPLSLGEPAMPDADLSASFRFPDVPIASSSRLNFSSSSHTSTFRDTTSPTINRRSRSTEKVILSLNRPDDEIVNLLLQIAEANDSEIRFVKALPMQPDMG